MGFKPRQMLRSSQQVRSAPVARESASPADAGAQEPAASADAAQDTPLFAAVPMPEEPQRAPAPSLLIKSILQGYLPTFMRNCFLSGFLSSLIVKLSFVVIVTSLLPSLSSP